ncbi:MAG: hypothetical protein HYV03_03945 [Deltaproteobacteria bacterium]|nr:hypothetical protein [Deltaproteobacteria bacterium]
MSACATPLLCILHKLTQIRQGENPWLTGNVRPAMARITGTGRGPGRPERERQVTAPVQPSSQGSPRLTTGEVASRLLWAEMAAAVADKAIIPSIAAQRLFRALLFTNYKAQLGQLASESTEIAQLLGERGGTPDPARAWELLKGWLDELNVEGISLGTIASLKREDLDRYFPPTSPSDSTAQMAGWQAPIRFRRAATLPEDRAKDYADLPTFAGALHLLFPTEGDIARVLRKMDTSAAIFIGAWTGAIIPDRLQDLARFQEAISSRRYPVRGADADRLADGWAWEKVREMEVTDPFPEETPATGRALSRLVRLGVWRYHSGSITSVAHKGDRLWRLWKDGMVPKVHGGKRRLQRFFFVDALSVIVGKEIAARFDPDAIMTRAVARASAKEAPIALDELAADTPWPVPAILSAIFTAQEQRRLEGLHPKIDVVATLAQLATALRHGGNLPENTYDGVWNENPLRPFIKGGKWSVNRPGLFYPVALARSIIGLIAGTNAALHSKVVPLVYDALAVVLRWESPSEELGPKMIRLQRFYRRMVVANGGVIKREGGRLVRRDGAQATFLDSGVAPANNWGGLLDKFFGDIKTFITQVFDKLVAETGPMATATLDWALKGEPNLRRLAVQEGGEERDAAVEDLVQGAATEAQQAVGARLVIQVVDKIAKRLRVNGSGRKAAPVGAEATGEGGVVITPEPGPEEGIREAERATGFAQVDPLFARVEERLPAATVPPELSRVPGFAGDAWRAMAARLQQMVFPALPIGELQRLGALPPSLRSPGLARGGALQFAAAGAGGGTAPVGPRLGAPRVISPSPPATIGPSLISLVPSAFFFARILAFGEQDWAAMREAAAAESIRSRLRDGFTVRLPRQGGGTILLWPEL